MLAKRPKTEFGPFVMILIGGRYIVIFDAPFIFNSFDIAQARIDKLSVLDAGITV